MRPFTKEELDKLAVYENSFSTAVNSSYARNIPPSAQETIRKTYEDALGKPYNPNGNCSHCIYTMLKLVGTKYFKDKEEYLKNAERLVEVLDQVFGDVPDIDEEPEVEKPKKKTTRKTKKQ